MPHGAFELPTLAQEPRDAERAAATSQPLFTVPSSSEPSRARGERRSLTQHLTSVDLGDIDQSIGLFSQLVTLRTIIARDVEDLRRPALEAMRNNARLRRIIDVLAGEFEVVRRQRRAVAQRDGWDSLELETFDSHSQIMLELNEIVADQEAIGDGLTGGIRRAALSCESDREQAATLQKMLLGFRLMRLNTIEPRLDQVITATARAVGKSVQWKLRGGLIAMDKTVLDGIQEPLLHLLRNAIDHGLERPRSGSRPARRPRDR